MPNVRRQYVANVSHLSMTTVSFEVQVGRSQQAVCILLHLCYLLSAGQGVSHFWHQFRVGGTVKQTFDSTCPIGQATKIFYLSELIFPCPTNHFLKKTCSNFIHFTKRHNKWKKETSVIFTILILLKLSFQFQGCTNRSLEKTTLEQLICSIM